MAAAAETPSYVMCEGFLTAIARGHPNNVKNFVEVEAADLDGPPFELPAEADTAPPIVDDKGLHLSDPGDITYVTPLSFAIVAQQVPTAKYLVEKGGANPDGASCDGRRPLHVAVSKGHAELIQWLVEMHSAEVNPLNFARETPIYHALYFKKIEVFKYLLSKGADIKLATTHGFTCLHMAASAGLLEQVEHLATALPQSINAQSVDGVTPLHLAAMCGHFDVCAYLLDNGADIHTKDKAENTALRLAILKLGGANDQDRVAVELCKRGACPAGSKDAEEASGELLQLASSLDDRGAVAVALIESGCNISTLNADGQRPIHTAAFNGTTGVLRALIKAKADVNQVDDDGETPAFYADLGGHDDVLARLKQHGANVDDL